MSSATKALSCQVYHDDAKSTEKDLFSVLSVPQEASHVSVVPI